MVHGQNNSQENIIIGILSFILICLGIVYYWLGIVKTLNIIIGLFIIAGIIVGALIHFGILSLREVVKPSNDILLKIKKLSCVKKVFFSIIIFAVVGSVMFYSYKPQESQLVVAISPFDYIDESGKSGSDINTANDLREKIEQNKDLGIKVIMLNNPISDTEDAKSQGKKVGAHVVIYGETKSKIGNRGEIKYNILPLAILEETLAIPSFEIKNVEKDNLIFSEKAKFSIVTEERITIIESIEENVSSSIYTIGAFEKYKKSNFTSAIAFFKSVKNYENESSILFYIANCYLFNNNLNESLQYFDKAIEIKPKFAEACCNKGNVFGHLGRYEEAVAAYDKATEIKPQYAKAWYNKGTALGHLRRYEEAVAAYDKAIEIKPKFAEAWNNKGVALYALRRYEEAVAAYDKATEIKPQYAKVWYNKGTALGHLRRYEEAVAAYDKATEINQKLADAWYNKGVALENLGRYKDAEEAFEIAHKLDSNT